MQEELERWKDCGILLKNKSVSAANVLLWVVTYFLLALCLKNWQQQLIKARQDFLIHCINNPSFSFNQWLLFFCLSVCFFFHLFNSNDNIRCLLLYLNDFLNKQNLNEFHCLFSLHSKINRAIWKIKQIFK